MQGNLIRNHQGYSNTPQPRNHLHNHGRKHIEHYTKATQVFRICSSVFKLCFGSKASGESAWHLFHRRESEIINSANLKTQLSNMYLNVLTSWYTFREIGRIARVYFTSFIDFLVVDADTRVPMMLTIECALSLRSNTDGFGWLRGRAHSSAFALEGCKLCEIYLVWCLPQCCHKHRTRQGNNCETLHNGLQLPSAVAYSHYNASVCYDRLQHA